MFLIKIAIFISLLIVYELTEKLLQLILPKMLFVQVNYTYSKASVTRNLKSNLLVVYIPFP